MSKPLVVDLCCGLGGWTRGFLAEGYQAVGFDIERHVYGEKRYPAQLVLQDIRTLHGSQFRGAAVIVASPPCEQFSRHQMPWTKRRNPPEPDLTIAAACWRIAAEAGVPIVLENVRMAQNWFGSAAWHCGSFYLWGDVPALMPTVVHRSKENLSSGARMERASVPLDLAQWIAQCFYQPGYPARAAMSSCVRSTESTPLNATVLQSRNGTAIPMQRAGLQNEGAA